MFGCVPILFLGLVFVASRGKIGFDDMQRQIHEGVFLFVCVAMMGGVMLDHLQSKAKFSARKILLMIFMPLFAVGILLLEYLFVVLKIIGMDCFNITCGTSSSMFAFSLVYCIANKFKLLIKEDFNHA